MKFNLALILGLAVLSGCSALQSKVEMDLSGASAAATKAGHPERAVCYDALGGVASVNKSGLVSGFEKVLEGREVATGPCAPIIAGLGLHLLDKLPVTP